MDIIGGFPVYILDDGSIHFVLEDIGHTDYWERDVSKIVARMYGIPRSELINLPYCQRRGRVVGDRFFYGETISQRLFKKLEKAVGRKLVLIYDDHEKRCPISVKMLTGLKP